MKTQFTYHQNSNIVLGHSISKNCVESFIYTEETNFSSVKQEFSNLIFRGNNDCLVFFAPLVSTTNHKQDKQYITVFNNFFLTLHI